jgi:hypothetical protein
VGSSDSLRSSDSLGKGRLVWQKFRKPKEEVPSNQYFLYELASIS